MPLPPFHVHPSVLLLVGGLAGWYAVGVAGAGRRVPRPEGRGATRRQIVLFALGLAALLAASFWPVHDLSERYLYSAHMVQHLLLSLVAPPLLLAGAPAWVLRGLLSPPVVRRAAGALTRPLVALVVFNAVIVLSHWPAVVDLTVRSELGHFAAHAILVGASFLMWWPVLSPLPELPPLSPPGQMLYLFCQSLLPTVPASFLTFGSTPLYEAYVGFPRIWGISALADMRIAGLTMKLAGGLILWTCITAIFFRWHREEQTEGWDSLGWRDVERDVRARLSR